MSEPIQIAPSVALREAEVLIEHYRHRNLILAQAVAEAQAEIAGRDEVIARLQAEHSEAPK